MIWTAGTCLDDSLQGSITKAALQTKKPTRPGDFVQWTGDGETRVAIVQSLDPIERTANVRWLTPTSNEAPTAVVSCLELDPVSSFLL